jgi:lipopolysaccharide biosynthesis protein
VGAEPDATARPARVASARLIAYYLPQFYPTPYNDAWWGPGFTEWTSVARALPLYPGHYQPHIPADLGFYDLRLPEVRAAQAALASDHGIEGFCYWHYWMGGRRLLERPFEEVLSSGEPRFPFCLAWANHSWAGVWFGGPKRMLAEQIYPGPDDHAAHFRFLLRAFSDERYIKVDGKPLFVIYRPGEIPDGRRMLDLWRQMAVEAGLPGLHLVGEGLDPDRAADDGFDATTFSRQWHVKGAYPPNRVARRVWALARAGLKQPAVYSYAAILRHLLGPGPAALNEYPALVPCWDTTPRMGRHGYVFHASTPDLWRRHLRQGLAHVAWKPPAQRIVFVKSWNEWAEGNHLEPDLRYGRGFLRALREELVRSADTAD